MSAPALKAGDMVQHEDGTIGRVIEVLEALQPGAAQIVEWRTAVKSRRTSSELALKVIDESGLRWRKAEGST